MFFLVLYSLGFMFVEEEGLGGEGCVFGMVFDKGNERRYQNNYIIILLGMLVLNLVRLMGHCLDGFFCVLVVFFLFYCVVLMCELNMYMDFKYSYFCY